MAEIKIQKEWLRGKDIRSQGEALMCKHLIRGMVPQIQMIEGKIPRRITGPHELGHEIVRIPKLASAIQPMYMICESPELLAEGRAVLPDERLGAQLQQYFVSYDICCGCPFWEAKVKVVPEGFEQCVKCRCDPFAPYMCHDCRVRCAEFLAAKEKGPTDDKPAEGKVEDPPATGEEVAPVAE